MLILNLPITYKSIKRFMQTSTKQKISSNKEVKTPESSSTNETGRANISNTKQEVDNKDKQPFSSEKQNNALGYQENQANMSTSMENKSNNNNPNDIEIVERKAQKDTISIENNSNKTTSMDIEQIDANKDIPIKDIDLSIYLTPEQRKDIEITVKQKMEEIRNKLSGKNNKVSETVEKNKIDKIDEVINTTFNEHLINSSYATEVKLVDATIKSVSASLDTISNALGTEIKKSDELAKEWKKNINSLDIFIKSLSSWKKTFGWSVCLLTVLAMLWKMGALRSIPNFLGQLTHIVPDVLSPLTKQSSSDIAKEHVSTTLHTVLDTPLTPLTIVTGVGVLTLGVGLLKTIAWVIQRAPK